MQLRAYLVSGTFRVHQADCVGCERKARRRDSIGNAGEYASKAAVIADLWSDVIAEDPDFYATPGGMAALEAETIFLPCTRGLPMTDTSLARPPEASSQPGDADELAAWAEELGLEPGDLDELINDAFSRQASETNSGGLGSQVRFLVETYGTGHARSLISDLLPGVAEPADRPGGRVPLSGAVRRAAPPRLVRGRRQGAGGRQHPARAARRRVLRRLIGHRHCG
jgi:hypothetical protein